MAFTEVVEKRKSSGLVFKDGNRFSFHSVLGTVLSHKGSLVDMTPVRRNDGVLDGWEVTTAGWHYRIGKPNGKATDGWVGFGGREGQHWIYTRLLRVGYLHYPTRAWQDVGGAPSYSRANLSSSNSVVSVGPADAKIDITALSSTEWRSLWTTPGSGEVYARWNVEGKKLKEEIVVNQAARTWVTNNAPPSTPAASTYFGFVFQLDVSDIPRLVKNGIVQDINGDFDDDDGFLNINIETSAQELLGFLPISTAYSTDGMTKIKLRKRIWKDADTNIYLLVGAKVTDLSAISGDIVFDPTYQNQPDATAGDDANLKSSSPTTNFPTDTFFQVGNGLNSAVVKFDLSSIDPAATLSSATLSVWSLVGAGGSVQTCDVYRIRPARSSWTETTVTWNTYDGSNNWAAGGGIGSTDIDNVTPMGSVAIPVANGTQCDFVLNVAQMTTLFASNAGMLFYQSSADSSAFSTSDAGTAGLRPRLTIDYSVPVVAAAPVSVSGGVRRRMRSEDELNYHKATPLREATLNVRLASQNLQKDSHVVTAAEFRKKVDNR